jgi:hypothetical protein
MAPGPVHSGKMAAAAKERERQKPRRQMTI